jgi:hypothetical protein
MYIKPRHVQTHDGLVLANVYDPERKDRLPPEGRDVPDTPYWRRRMNEGAIEFVDPLPATPDMDDPQWGPKEDLQ